MLAVYYLTYACNFRCPYCSDGTKKPYYKIKSPILPGSQVIELLKIIRSHSDFIVLTGGEPLNHPEFGYVMEQFKGLKFKGAVLTTNGYNISHYLSEISTCIDYLVFSLDTLNHEKADNWFGVGKGALERILCNIDQAANFYNRKYEIIISSVVTPDNIKDLYEVYYYAKKRGFRFAACPQLVGVKAHQGLMENPDYRSFYDFLIAEKRNGYSINGTVLYLKYMRDLKKFSCRPFTMLVVSPTGDVFYPCLEIGKFAGNLLEEHDLHVIRKKGMKLLGHQPKCDVRCHSACALGFSLILSYPLSGLYEAYLIAKSKLRFWRETL